MKHKKKRYTTQREGTAYEIHCASIAMIAETENEILQGEVERFERLVGLLKGG